MKRRLLIEEGLSQMAFDAATEKIEKLEIFLDLLREENKRLNLIGTDDPRTVIVKHVFDVLAGLPHFPAQGMVADVGAGAGFPGMILAIFSSLSFLLIEAKRKKFDFLEKVREKLFLPNVEILPLNIREVERKVDIITSRAFAPLNKTLRFTSRMRRPETRYFLYKGRKERIEREFLEARARGFQAIRLKIPFLGEERHLVIGPEKTPKFQK